MRYLPLLFLALAGFQGLAQNRPPSTFGKVTAEDFAVNFPGLDTSADAVVVSDVGVRTFERPYALSTQWDGYLQHTRRVLILKRRGFEAATVVIPLFSFKGRSEEIMDLKAATYNLEGGKVVKTELAKNSVFKEKLSENVMTERFAFPAVREGSIVEYTYKEKSEFGFSNETWIFQGSYPCLWSEYLISIPAAFGYSVVPHSYLPFCIDTTQSEKSDYGAVYGAIRTYHWAIKDIPALKEQPYTTTIRNWLARVEIRPG